MTPPPPTTFKEMVLSYALGAYKFFFVENVVIETLKRAHSVRN
jgi:hypothetical protein